jgi:hypothetical protein
VHPDERAKRRNIVLGPAHGVPVRVLARRDAARRAFEQDRRAMD